MKDVNALNNAEMWSNQELRELAEEAFAAGDEAQAEMVAAELRARGAVNSAHYIESTLATRRA